MSWDTHIPYQNAWVRVPVPPLSSVHAGRQQLMMAEVLWSLPLHGRPLLSGWPISGHCGHLGSEPVDE